MVLGRCPSSLHRQPKLTGRGWPVGRGGRKKVAANGKACSSMDWSVGCRRQAGSPTHELVSSSQLRSVRGIEAAPAPIQSRVGDGRMKSAPAW